MRTGLLAAALLLAATRAPAADPPLPPIVFQVQPVGQVIDNVRAAADVVGGDKGVKAVNRFVKDVFGEKGLEGLDLNRPIVGYVVLAPKPENITAVVALPVTGEKEFLAFCDRTNKDKVQADGKDKTLYHLPPPDPEYKALMRFSNQYAYIAYGANPAPHIDAKALVPMPKLYDPAERGLVAGRVHFDRIPLAVKLAAPLLFAEVKKTVLGAFDLDRGGSEWLAKAVTPELEKLAVRYALLAAGADVLTARLVLDAKAGNFVAEATLTAKPGSELAKVIAAYKTTPNRFASLINHPDTVAGFATRVPLFAPEVRAALAAGLEAGGKEAAAEAPAAVKDVLQELFKGLSRTVKGGELDVAVALRGADKDGWFHVVGAVAFDDPAALEKEFKAMLQKTLPKDELDRITWDAAKVGKVGIHTSTIPQGGFIDFTKLLGGEKCTAAFAFAPHGLIGAIGPDPVSVVKDVLAAKPAAAKDLEVVVNPGRLVKAFEKGFGPDNRDAVEMASRLGKEDKILPTMSVEVTGGKELRATFTMNLKLLPRLMFADAIDQANRDPKEKPVPPDPDKK